MQHNVKKSKDHPLDKCLTNVSNHNEILYSTGVNLSIFNVRQQKEYT